MMQGEAGGDGGRVMRNTRKRDLHDASPDGSVKDNPSSKRRLTTGAQGHDDDDESTSNSSRFKPHRPKAEKNSTSKSPKHQLDDLRFSLRSSGPPAPPAPQKFSGSPFSNDSVARPSGPSGATGGLWGAPPSLPGGVFSGYGQHKSSRNPLTTEPPTSSTTPLDAHSIPALSNRILPFPTSKHKTRASLESSSYGFEPARGAPAEEDGHNDKHLKEARGRSHNARRGATGTQSWPPKRQGAVLPSSRLNGTRETPQAISSSDDDSYVEEREEEEGSSDDDAFPTTRQRSARLMARGRTVDFSETRDDGLNDEQGIEQGPYRKTPSGKDYHKLPSESKHNNIGLT